MDEKVEDKHLITTLENLQLHNSAISSGDVISIMPVPVLGTNDYNRIGAKITPKYLVVKGTISVIRAGMVINRPIGLRVIAFNQRDVKSYTASGSVQTGALLRSANGGSQSYDGTLLNHLLPLNDELFSRISDKTYKLDQQSSNGTGGDFEGTNTRTSVIAFSFKVKCPKTLKFDNTSAFPNNHAPFMAVGYCFLDGTSADITSTNVQVTSYAHLKYEDA